MSRYEGGKITMNPWPKWPDLGEGVVGTAPGFHPDGVPAAGEKFSAGGEMHVVACGVCCGNGIKLNGMPCHCADGVEMERKYFVKPAMTGDRAGDCAGDQKRSKYHREITGIAMIDGKPRKVTMTVDFYDVVKAFDVRCGALQHLIKKALAAGQRGHKDLAQDMQDIVDSAVRAKELAE